MSDHLRADDHRFLLPTGKAAPFSREEFLKFCGELKVQSKDGDLAPFRLTGNQIYILDDE